MSKFCVYHLEALNDTNTSTCFTSNLEKFGNYSEIRLFFTKPFIMRQNRTLSF